MHSIARWKNLCLSLVSGVPHFFLWLHPWLLVARVLPWRCWWRYRSAWRRHCNRRRDIAGRPARPSARRTSCGTRSECSRWTSCKPDTCAHTTLYSIALLYSWLQCFDTVGLRGFSIPGKHWVMRCWCGYLSGARCRLFAYGPADATASKTPPSLASFKSRLVYLSGTGLLRLFWKRGR